MVPFLSCVVAILAATAAWQSASAAKKMAEQARLTQQVQLRPYVIIQPVSNVLPYKGSSHVTLPYQLENKGTAPALHIRKGYKSFLVDQSGKENLIQAFDESKEKTDALAPSQSSAIHMDEINISGFNSEIVQIKVELKVTYEGFQEVDGRRNYSKATLILTPKKINGDKIVFGVAQPYLDFGFENVSSQISFRNQESPENIKEQIGNKKDWSDPNNEKKYKDLFVLFYAVFFGSMLASCWGLSLFQWGQLFSIPEVGRRLLLSLILLNILPIFYFSGIYQKINFSLLANFVGEAWTIFLIAFLGLSVFGFYRFFQLIITFDKMRDWLYHSSEFTNDDNLEKRLKKILEHSKQPTAWLGQSLAIIFYLSPLIFIIVVELMKHTYLKS